jgi:hypothetical protein
LTIKTINAQNFQVLHGLIWTRKKGKELEMSTPKVTKKNTMSAKPVGKPGDKKQPKPRRVKKQRVAIKALTPKAKFSRANMTKSLRLLVDMGEITQDEMYKKLAKLSEAGALTDGSKSKGIIEGALFKAGTSAVGKTRRKGSPSGCHGFVDDNAKKVIVYVTSCREGSTKYRSLAKGEFANTDRILSIEKKKRNAKS